MIIPAQRHGGSAKKELDEMIKSLDIHVGRRKTLSAQMFITEKPNPGDLNRSEL
jgi:hypothetical protein